MRQSRYILAEKYSYFQAVPQMEGIRDGVPRKQDMVDSEKGRKKNENSSGNNVYGEVLIMLDQAAKTSTNADARSLRFIQAEETLRTVM